MKTKITKNNPYANVINAKFNGSKAYFVEKIGLNKNNYHLDFGANDGEFIKTLKNHELISRGVGLDANSSVVNKNKCNVPEQQQIKFKVKCSF